MKSVYKKEENVIVQLWNKFFPFWPLFVGLLIIAISGAWLYLKYSTPLYEASASILIKDEKKGSDDSKLSESLNYLSSKKIVENEIEVLHSKSLLKQVVKKKHLYANVYQEGKWKPSLLYATSPIKVEYQNVDTITVAKKIPFTYDASTKQVTIDGKAYPSDQFVNTPYGVMKFTSSGKAAADAPMFITLNNPKTVANNIAAGLDVSAVSKVSSVVHLGIKDESPDKAEDILRGILEGYNELQSVEKNELAKNTSSFVEDRLHYIKQDIDSIERKIQKYKQQKGAIDISSQGRLFLENVSTNDQKLSDINMQLAVLRQVQNYVESKNSAGGIVPSTLGVSDPLLSQLLDKLYSAELQYEKLKKTTAENNPILVSVTDEINKIKPSILENIESQERSLQASRNNLHATNGAYTSIIQSIPQKEKELVEISREHSIKSNIYNFLLQKREEAALSSSENTLNNKVVDEPQASPYPVSPNSKLIYIISIVVALIVGISLIVGKEMMSRKILYRNEIEKLTIYPVVGEIGYEKTGKALLITDNKRGLIAEQFRKLRATLSYMGINADKKRILVTSTISGEGKSFIAANLGLTLAIAGKKVMLVELDLCNPSLSRKLGIHEEKGVTNFLEGDVEPSEIIKVTKVHNNLYIIPSGNLPENPSELIMNGKVEELFDYLEDRYDYIIVDTAPVGALSDAYILSPLCDSTLYVVRHKHTPKASLERFDDNNKINELKNVKIVFNGVQSRGFTNGYYGYGYGYSNGYYKNSSQKTTKLLPDKTA